MPCEKPTEPVTVLPIRVERDICISLLLRFSLCLKHVLGGVIKHSFRRLADKR